MLILRQNYSCGTAKCRLWKDEGCGCSCGTITIENGRCSSMELKERICICISNGQLSTVYSTIDNDRVDVTLLDLDDASRKGSFEKEHMERQIDTISCCMHQIYGL